MTELIFEARRLIADIQLLARRTARACRHVWYRVRLYVRIGTRFVRTLIARAPVPPRARKRQRLIIDPDVNRLEYTFGRTHSVNGRNGETEI